MEEVKDGRVGGTKVPDDPATNFSDRRRRKWREKKKE